MMEWQTEARVMVHRCIIDLGRQVVAALLIVAAGLLAAAPARADDGASPWFETQQGKVRLIAASPTVDSGADVQLGLQFELASGWKIYWRSPGDAGFPPHLDWSRSDNLASAEMAWPVPQRFSVQGLETIGYEDEVVLPIAAHPKQAGAPLHLRAALDYLTCREICIPYQAVLELALPAGGSPAGASPPGADAYAALIERFRSLVPPHAAAGLAVDGATFQGGSSPALFLRVSSAIPLKALDIFLDAPGGVAFGAPVITAPKAGARDTLARLSVSGDAASLASLLDHPLTVTLVAGARSLETTVQPTQAPPLRPVASMLSMLALALLGGLILNLMPCVLPVLSIKLLSVIDHAGRTRAEQRLGFLGNATGILLSFLALAVAMIILKSAGTAVGWGIQFQQPWFLIAMAALLILFAANLWDFFAVPLPGFADRLAPAGQGRVFAGNVAVGAFVTLLATPCSAPFLGTAVGFALASGPGDIIGIFLALGIGLALPYLAVALMPSVAYVLPRPGLWMIKLRRILGVVLALTALWLVSVLAAQIGVAGALAVAALLLVIAGFLGLAHRPLLRRGVPAAAVIGALLVPLVARAPAAATGADAMWRAFDPASIADLVGTGHVVFVDVTADWCLSCKVNERLVLDAASVRSRLRAPGVVAMRADWTQPSETIAGYLKRFGRYGIPFNAVYGPGAPNGLPLSEFLTQDAVTGALQQAAGAPSRLGAATP